MFTLSFFFTYYFIKIFGTQAAIVSISFPFSIISPPGTFPIEPVEVNWGGSKNASPPTIFKIII